MSRNVEITVNVVLQDGATAEQAAEAAFDVLASVGENADALQRFDKTVETVDGYAWTEIP